MICIIDHNLYTSLTIQFKYQKNINQKKKEDYELKI